MVPLANLFPAARDHVADSPERLRQAEPGAVVLSPGPLELFLEAGDTVEWLGRAMAYDQRVHRCLEVAPDVKEARAFGATHPLVAVAGIPGRSNGGDIEVEHARDVGAVDECFDASFGQFVHKVGDGEDECCRAGDMVEHGDLCPGRYRREDRGNDVLLAFQGKRHTRDDNLCARPGGGGIEGVLAGSVGMVGGEQLIAGLQFEPAEHGVHARCGVGGEDDVFGLTADEGREVDAGMAEERPEIAAEKLHRLPLHAGSELGLLLEYGARSGAEGAVVEEGDMRVEVPVAREVGGHGVMVAGWWPPARVGHLARLPLSRIAFCYGGSGKDSCQWAGMLAADPPGTHSIFAAGCRP